MNLSDVTASVLYNSPAAPVTHCGNSQVLLFPPESKRLCWDADTDFSLHSLSLTIFACLFRRYPYIVKGNVISMWGLEDTSYY